MNEFLVLGGLGEILLVRFCDAAFNKVGNCKSRIGGCLFLGKNSGAFHSFSKFASCVAMSSTHAELQALDEMVRAYRDVLQFLKWKFSSDKDFYGQCQHNRVVQISKNDPQDKRYEY